MEQHYSSTKLPTVGANTGVGYPPNASWNNPSRITADDGSSANIAFVNGGQPGDLLVGSSFAFQSLPEGAVIDGIMLTVDGSQTGCFGDITLNLTGTSSKSLGTLSGNYGGSTDLWGADEIDASEIPGLTVSVFTNDVSGGDGVAAMDYMSVTLYWHIELTGAVSDVPTRVDYKTYSPDGTYLGLLPKVTSRLGFSQDINSAGSSIQIVCGIYPQNETTVEPILDNNGDPILTNADLPILATSTDVIMALGDSDDPALFKNGNRVQAWLYNYWHPNGKLMFSGQVNKISFRYGGSAAIALTVYSDGIDLDNYIARGYPFAYTTDQSQTSSTDRVSVVQDVFGAWTYYGQSYRTGVGQTNVGQIQLKMDGTASVNVYLLDGPNGNVLGSVSKLVSVPPDTVVNFDFPQLIPVSASTDYFIRVTVANNNSIWLYRNSAGGYANGEMYQSDYSGGSGGGSYVANGGGDLYFVTKSGVPTTTTTYSTDDPVTDMAHGILLDYNARGGIITERDFVATGLSLTYPFVVATILDAIKKVIELSPTGYYSYIDLGTAEIDILPTNDSVADFTIVRGKDINELDMALTIEQVKNYLLLSGGDTGGGTNLFREYKDGNSASRYGVRLSTKSDNRITLNATADAIGESFIEEYAGESQETTVSVLNKMIDITLLTPGKTIGFRNFGNFIDDMVLQITRRDYTPERVSLTLGRLPVTMPAEIQKLNRDMQMQQTIDNPTAPS